MFCRLLPAALALTAVLSLTSCLDYDEELTINSDLSGEASVILTLPDTLISKYERIGIELAQAKIEKRLENASGVRLVRYEKTEGRQPKIRLVIKFTSLDKLNDAIAANPPASIWAGRFAISTQDGLTTVDRKLGVGDAGVEMPEYNSVLYKTHFDGNITATNSSQFNSPGKDVRYRYQLSDMVGRQPTQSTTFAKSWPWLLILGCLAAIGGAAWFGWEYFGKQKPVEYQRTVPQSPEPDGVPEAGSTSSEGAPPRRPGPPQPRRPGPPPQ